MKKKKLLGTQFLTSLISTTLVLVMLGTVVFFARIAPPLGDNLRENNTLTLFLYEDLDSAEIEGVIQHLNSQPFVKSLDYISKEDAALQIAQELGTDSLEFLEYNPLSPSIIIHPNAAYANEDSLAKISRQLQNPDLNPEVEEAYYEHDLTENINTILYRVNLILLVIALLFTLISFQLIKDTVSLTIFAHRFTINTMKLVGASWRFICKPFLKRALVLGLCASVIAMGIIFFGMQQLSQFEPAIAAVTTIRLWAEVGIAVLAFGLIITFLCTLLSLHKYLRMSSNELYHV